VFFSLFSPSTPIYAVYLQYVVDNMYHDNMGEKTVVLVAP
jgi:hypothetical protein